MRPKTDLQKLESFTVGNLPCMSCRC